MQAVLPHMLDNKFGVIVNMGSMSHRRGGPGSSVHYASAKGAVVTMTMGVNAQVRHPGHPRLVDLARADQDAVPGRGGDLAQALHQKFLDDVPMGRFGEPEKIAANWCCSCARTPANS